MFHKCKITVVKRMVNEDLVNEFATEPKTFPICDRVKDGQEFFVTNPYEMPEGICPWAWADIRSFILTIASGGTYSEMKNTASTVATCTDPFRPVIFKIEKVHG